ncbi:MAG: ABC transporter permease [Oscillospiraceae bacterium]|nr:ABC transporter permease [Oscillospiraceae bacterium]
MRRRVSFPYVGWMAVFVVVPMVLVLGFSFTSADGGFTFENFSEMTKYAPVFARSIWLAFLSTVICLIIGYPAALVMSREKPIVASAALMLLMLPMWMNFLLRTYAWMSILENNGFLNQLLGALKLPPVAIINTDGAVLLGMVYNYLPFMILPIHTVLHKMDKHLLEAASDLGADSVKAFARVILPLTLPGVLSGVTMVFVPSVSTFVISKLLGGGKTMMLGDLIEMQFTGNAYNPYLGSAISLVMMVMVLASMTIMNRFGDGEESAVMM